MPARRSRPTGRSTKMAKTFKQYYHENRVELSAKAVERGRRLKVEVINAYGGRCRKCGFKDIRALCIDHVNAGGKRDKYYGRGRAMYWFLKRSKYPPGYQVLCANCNLIKAFENKEFKPPAGRVS